MSYTDTEKMDLARAWAEWVHGNPAVYGGTSDRARAAADVVASLPEVVVDGYGLQGLAELIRANVDELDDAGAQPWRYGHLLRQVVAGLEDMLPTHYPAHECAADVLYSVSYGGAVHTAWRVDNDDMPWLVSVGRWTTWAADEEVRVLGLATSADDADADDLTALREARADDDGTRVTLEQVAEADPAYIYTDRDGREWEYLGGRWITGDTHAERVTAREDSPGRASLPDAFAPYRKDRLATPVAPF